MARVTANTSGSISMNWGASHKDKDGNVISVQADIVAPVYILDVKCVKPLCILKGLISFLWDFATYSVIFSYHSRRINYCEKNRHKKILDRYRLGEHAPTNMRQALFNHIKLTCPFCRTKEFSNPWIIRLLAKLDL